MTGQNENRVASTPRLRFAGHPTPTREGDPDTRKRQVATLPRANLPYVRASCKTIQRHHALLRRVVRDLPTARLRVVAYEDLIGPDADAVLGRLVTFLGAKDATQRLTTTLVRLSSNHTGHFADDAAAIAALAEAGCPEHAPVLLDRPP